MSIGREFVTGIFKELNVLDLFFVIYVRGCINVIFKTKHLCIFQLQFCSCIVWFFVPAASSLLPQRVWTELKILELARLESLVAQIFSRDLQTVSFFVTSMSPSSPAGCKEILMTRTNAYLRQRH